MFKILILLGACLALAVAAPKPKPDFLAAAPVVAAPAVAYSAYTSPYAYSGYVSPYYAGYASPYAYPYGAAYTVY